MKVDKDRIIVGVLFWGIILWGLILPAATKTAVSIIMSRMSIINAVRDGVEFFRINLWTWVLNDIPFIVAALFAKFGAKRANNKINIVGKWQVIGSVGVIIIVSLWLNLEIWLGSELSLPGSSTGVVAYSFFPFVGVIFPVVGYILGWIIGAISESRVEGRSSTIPRLLCKKKREGQRSRL